MSFPSWIRQRAERVRSEDLIMELPEVSSEEWIEAAKPYLSQAGQIAFAIEPSRTSVDDLLERAKEYIQGNNVSDRSSLVRSAFERQREISSPTCLDGWVKVAMAAVNSSDDELQREIVTEGADKFFENGLDEVAAAFRHYPDIKRQFGWQAANAYGTGMLSAVNAYCLRNAMEAGVDQE